MDQGALYGLMLGGLVLCGVLVGAAAVRITRRPTIHALTESELILAITNYLSRHGETEGAEEFRRALLMRSRGRDEQISSPKPEEWDPAEDWDSPGPRI